MEPRAAVAALTDELVFAVVLYALDQVAVSK